MGQNDKEKELDELLQTSLEEEAEAIKREIASDESLKHIEVTPAMDKAMEKLIEVYERDQAQKSEILGDDEKGGEEKQEGSDKTIKFRPRGKKRRKVFFLVAAVMIALLGFGMSSSGSRNIIKNMIDQAFGKKDISRIETDGESKLSIQKNAEEEAYEEANKTLDISAVRIMHTPPGTEFLGMEIFGGNEAYFEYEINGLILSYEVVVNRNEGSYGRVVDGVAKDEYYFYNDKVEMLVREYEQPGISEKQFDASFEYQNVNYFLNGYMEKSDFEEILKNLQFF